MPLAPLAFRLGVAPACVAPVTLMGGVAVQSGHRKLRAQYLSDSLCTLITRTFNNSEVGRIGLGRTEKLVKLSELVDFCEGEIFPRVVFPAKEPCMQTTVLK
jgi:hypothetical protein